MDIRDYTRMMQHPVIRNLPLCKDIRETISHMRYLDVWKGKVRRLNREYLKEWHLIDESYLQNSRNGIANDRDFTDCEGFYGFIFDMRTSNSVDIMSPNYVHARLYP